MTAAPYTTPHTPSEARPWPAGLAEQNRLQECLHEGHAHIRDRLILALHDSPIRSIQRAARRIVTCGSYATFYMDLAQAKVRNRVYRCGHRLCPMCSRQRVARATEQMAAIVDAMDHPRTLILTVKSSTEHLGTQLVDLRNWFARLRRTKLWRRTVRGGVYTIEITINEKTGLWHPHIHIVFDGDFLPFRQLRYNWHRITNGSEIVWLNDVKDRPGIVAELCKYIGKPARLHTFTDMQIRDYAIATHGARLMQTFGDCHGHKVQDRDKDPPIPEDSWQVGISRLVYLTHHASTTCANLLLLIADRWPRYASYIFHEFPQLEPHESKHRRQVAALAKIQGRAPPLTPRVISTTKLDELDAELWNLFVTHKAEQEADVYFPADDRGAQVHT